jgi:hypothetical protein
MRSKVMYVTAGALLVAAMIFAWTGLHGNAGIDAGNSVGMWKLRLNGEVTGWHALATIFCAVVGFLLLVVGIIKDVVGKD